MAAVLRRLRDLQSSAGNKICVDWSQKNPQWASVSYGVFIASARYRSTKDIYTQSQLEASAANKEGFFTRKMAENESRPEGLPPSQGGKYVGFGSSPTSSPQRRNDAQNDYFSAVSQGIGKLSLVAASAANVVQAGTKEFTSKAQEATVDLPYVAFAVRPNLGVWEFVRVSLEDHLLLLYKTI
ncbi:hypothetical protein JHK82_033575 [Glycine max]|nr:hypothetical protein JHK82_033575 [Glycine max]